MVAVLFALSLSLAPAAWAVSFDWVTVGDPGNVADDTGFGSVGETYRISKYEVTNAQYAEFLNAKAASDALGLYNTNMGSGFGGITRSGSDGAYSYSAIVGRESMPVNYVSFYDSVRFSNWLDNGQGSGDTETGAYTLLGGTAVPSNGLMVTRNAGANIFLPSEDEWYKAAYYDALSASYFNFPAGTDAVIGCAAPGAAANTANCGFVVGDLTDVGSYAGSASPNGTFDQGGNVWEWNDTITDSFGDRGAKGGGFQGGTFNLSSSDMNDGDPPAEVPEIGFRVASPIAAPEPDLVLLMITGLLCSASLASWRRRSGGHSVTLANRRPQS